MHSSESEPRGSSRTDGAGGGFHLDNIWDMEEDNFFRQELKRLAEELDGEYMACMDIYGNCLKAELYK